MKTYSHFGTFSKGVTGAIALNFAPSGGAFCSDSCPHKAGDCYAIRLEKVRPTIAASGLRKQSDHVGHLAYLAYADWVNPTVPWIRFSAFGSVPPNPEENADLWRTLASKLDPVRDRVHFPVETAEKYINYQSLGFSPRLSLQTDSVVSAVTAVEDGLRVSMVPRGETKKAAISAAEVKAADIRSAGKTAVVCPAITKGSKCGACKACASFDVDVVLYPEH